MSYGSTAFLRWANYWFGRVEHNLAKGGLPGVPWAELGLAEWSGERGSLHELRAGIARFNGVSPQEVVPALGTTHALWLALAARLEPGDEVVVESPGYEPLWRIPQGLGARVVRLPRMAEDAHRLRPEELSSRLGPRTRVVVITSPHNPSGARSSRADLQALARCCQDVGALLLVDEVYGPCGSALGADGRWGATARTVAPNVVTVGGLAKAYGLGALRVGWMLADPALVQVAEELVESTLQELPPVQIALATRVLDELPRLSVATAALESDGRREQVAAWVEARPRLSWHEPQGVPFGFVRMAGVEDLSVILEGGAERHGVLVAPGSFFGRPDAFRLGWSLAPERLPEALRRLDRVLGLGPG